MRRRRDDRGSQFIEFGAYLPLFLFVVALALETFFSFAAAERIESAARAGARVASTQGLQGAETTARRALPGWLDHAEVHAGANSGGGYYMEVQADMPIVFGVADIGLTLSRRVDMPNV
ncbi:hypothetical protein HDA32_004284 [Spinactinospora alkalitolerans]|uniref:Pilus assembly protein TadE n=1 Tax=Spinactinospora alkalitolerans TaxID=687207 RepID=A0A852U4Z9_9ACTN|nr:pilus assembly protein TadE [Spinactinospora alkalitolerans]NYE49164.1 hypothetical protein [Spinactinospora alkalitolerans]